MSEIKIVIVDIFRTLYKSIQQEGNSHNIPKLKFSYLKEEKKESSDNAESK